MNLRDDPTSQGSKIVGSAGMGQTVSGRMVTNDAGAEWLHITEGDHRGSYIWVGNIRPMRSPNPEPGMIGAELVSHPAQTTSGEKYRIRITCYFHGEQSSIHTCYMGGPGHAGFTVMSVRRGSDELELPGDIHDRKSVIFDVGADDFDVHIRTPHTGSSRIVLDVIDDGERVVHSSATSGSWETRFDEVKLNRNDIVENPTGANSLNARTRVVESERTSRRTKLHTNRDF